MTPQPTVAVLFGHVPPGAPADEKDVLVEVHNVSAALHTLGYRTVDVPVTLDLQAMVDELRRVAPVVVYNLVESLDGRDSLAHLAPAILSACGIRYTGASADAIHQTTDKHLAKQLMTYARIPTPPWVTAEELAARGAGFAPPYLVKLTSEDASKGIGDESVKKTHADLDNWVRSLSQGERRRHIVEKYVTGREFNISLLGREAAPQVLPPAEMLFEGFPPDKPAIVGYSAKWDRDSFEYQHTVRSFEVSPEDAGLREHLHRICLECWQAFGLSGYARVDFRVDEAGQPWVLEVNANPCISPDGGFAAAASRAGLAYEEVIRRIIQDALR
jgi:D-alanine-D-alanine ligase